MLAPATKAPKPQSVRAKISPKVKRNKTSAVTGEMRVCVVVGSKTKSSTPNIAAMATTQGNNCTIQRTSLDLKSNRSNVSPSPKKASPDRGDIRPGRTLPGMSSTPALNNN